MFSCLLIMGKHCNRALEQTAQCAALSSPCVANELKFTRMSKTEGIKNEQLLIKQEFSNMD